MLSFLLCISVCVCVFKRECDGETDRDTCGRREGDESVFYLFIF